MFGLLAKIFGSSNERIVTKYFKLLPEIHKFYESFKNFNESDFEECTNKFRERLKAKETLDAILPEAFALVQVASERVLGMKHYDVQLVGGMVLHDGKIVEMATGEGKTLVATLPSYLNALTGNPVHIVTVNDYLAQRDGTMMQPLFDLLSMKCEYITSTTPHHERAEKYNSDIIYITNNELGFDYLRDNMRHSNTDLSLMKHGLHYAIVDEIDSILIDESRTPLIISGPAEQSSDIYILSKDIVQQFKEGDFETEERHNSIYITDSGYQSIDKFLQKVGILKKEESLYSAHDLQTQIRNNHILHGVNQALKASKTLKENVDYMIRGTSIVIIDEFTGRIMEGRRYSDGLHQAIEAKHNLPIQQESQTLASITYQNYFRMYEKLSGMTGTAQTEAQEFHEIYGLSVVSVPTHRKMIRQDLDDSVYRTEKEKFDAIIHTVKEAHAKGQPILVGTASVQQSEKLSQIFSANNLKHNVLNAKHHEKEAEIIADTGKFGAITIATNMAGRGTDIILGGSLERKIASKTRYIDDEAKKQETVAKIKEEHAEEAQKVKDAGGLFVIGAERHESRRIDNQLRGRSGRQGDIGKSKFFLSLEDDLLRIFGGDKLKSMLKTLGFKEGESIEHPWLNRVISRSQKRIEDQNFEIRKNLIKYDDIMNKQRQIVYKKRMDLLSDTNSIDQYIADVFTKFVSDIKEYSQEEIDLIQSSLGRTEITVDNLLAAYKKVHGENSNNPMVKHISVALLDTLWKEHLYSVDSMKQAINLRSYAQKDPLNEYKIDVFKAFEKMLLNYQFYLVKDTIVQKFNT